MLPEEVYKRRHFGTPQSMLLIIGNYAVFAVSTSLFASGKTINWFFWVCIGLLAIYNYLNIRKDREEYTKVRIIAYVTSIVLIVLVFFVLRLKA
jgi:hypothetical protein